MPRQLFLLVVSQQSALAGSLSAALEAAGHGVTLANDGASALRLAAKSTFDLALLPLDLPDTACDFLIADLAACQPSLEFVILGDGPAVKHEQVLCAWPTSGDMNALVALLDQIASRRQAEQTLARERLILHTIMDHLPSGIYVKDTLARKTHSSRADFEAAGEESEEGILGKTDLEIFGEALGAQSYADDLHLLATGEPLLRREESVALPGGESHWILTNKVPLVDREGNIQGLVGIAHDISDRKRAEDALRESEERYRNLYERSPLPYQSLDAEGRVIEVNQAWLSVLGYSREKVIGRWFADFVAPEALDSFRQYFPRFLTAGQTYVELDMMHNDGSVITMAIDGRVGTDARGESIQTHCVLDDVTERRRTEETIRTQRETLSTLYRAGQQLSQTLDKDIIFLRLYDWVCQIMPCDGMTISSFSSQDQMIRCEFMKLEDQQIDHRQLPEIPLEPEGQGIQSRVIRSAEPLVVADTLPYLDSTSTAYQVGPDGALHDRDQEPDDGQKTRSEVLVPMILGGQVTGVIQVSSYVADAYTADHVQILSSLAGQAAAAYNNALLYQQAQDEIAERKRAERELLDNEELLNEVGQIAKIGGWEIDIITGKAIWTRGTYDVVGIEPGQPIPGLYDHASFYLPEYRPLVEEAVRALIEEDVSFDYEAELVSATGGRRWVRAVGRAERQDGRCVRIYGTFQDITERKQTADALALSDARFRVSFSASAMGMAIYDTEGHYISVNDAACRLLGYTKEEMLQKTVANVSHPDDIGDSGARYLQCLQDHQPYHIEKRYLTKSGDTVWVVTTVSPIVGGDGKHLYSIAHLQDVTERKLTEEALQESEAHFRAMMEQSPLGTAIFGPDGDLLQINQAYMELFGLTQEIADAVVGRFNLLKSEAMIDRGYMPLLGQAFEGNVVLLPAYQSSGPKAVEKLGLPSEGIKAPWLETRCYPLTDTEGCLTSVVVIHEDITEAKQAEEELRDRERVLAQAQRVAHLGNWVWHIQAKSMEWSDEMYRIFGIDKDSFVGNLDDVLEQAIHPEDRHLLGTSTLEIMGKRHPVPVEYRIVRTDGAVRTVWAQASELINDQAGRPVSVTGIMQDITERAEAEQALRQSEQRYRTLFENMVQGVFYQNADGSLIEVNQAAAKMFGLTRDELLKRTSRHYAWRVIDEDGELLQPDEHPSMVALQTGRAVHERLLGVYNPKQDDYTWMNVSALPLFRSGESKPYQTFVTMHDVTARKRANDALLQSERQLRALALRQQTLLAAIPDIVVETDVNQVYTWANPAGLAFFGKEAIGKHAADYLVGERETVLMARPVIEGSDDTVYLESWQRRQDGKERLLAWWRQPLRDDQGQVIGTLLTARDITEQRLIEEQLRQAQKMESVGRLAGGVAHDFNNMLQVILGHTEMVLTSLPVQDSLHESVDEIQHAAQRSADLTRQLLAFARQQTVAPQVLDLNDAISSTLRMLQRLIGEEIELIWKPGANLRLVEIDPSQVDQILANLSVNARDAIDGVGQMLIETGNVDFDEDYCRMHSECTPGEYVLVGVSDTGVGMTPEIMAHLFEPFFTTKEVGQGTGLGLATIYGIVKQNDGFINVYSEPGEGTTFKIYLPRKQAEIEPNQPSAPRQVPRGFETVLVVEDEPTILRLAEMTLKRLGYVVLAALMPSEALRISGETEGTIDLLVSDVVMPEMNGRALRDKLLKERPELKTLFMSGYTADVVVHRGVVEQGVELLQKPFSIRDLAGAVRDVLDAR